MTNNLSQSEIERLNILKNYEILDTPKDGAFDRVTKIACAYFKVPISLVTLVDEDRIWFKSRIGLDINEIPRSPGLCSSAILSDDAYVIKNAIDDPRTLSNPLVAGDFGLRFYAAAPLVTHEGFRLGTINIIDFIPRDLTEDDELMLKNLAGLVMDQMELRLSSRKMLESLSTAVQFIQSLGHLVTVCAWTKRIRLDGTWYSFEDFLEKKLGLDVTHGIHPEAFAKVLKNQSIKKE